MTRPLYRALLRLHPPTFRARFGDEMQSIFDETFADKRGTRDRAVMLGDAVTSVALQWFFRDDFRTAPEPNWDAPALVGAASTAGGPKFQLCDGPSTPRLFRGFLLSLASFWFFTFLLNHWGHAREATIGSRDSGSAGSLFTSRAASSPPDTAVTVRPEDILDSFAGRDLVRKYYREIPVLTALDTNHDLVISASEIANAPAVLRALDRDHDGNLDESECCEPRPRWAYKRMLDEPAEDPLSVNPVLVALDLDRDRALSRDEIRNAAARLAALDLDHDRKLTPMEVLSPQHVAEIKEFPNDTRH